MKTIGSILLPLTMLFLAGPSYSEPPFGPWNADVRVADETVHLHVPSPPRRPSVYNGPQGAAWILIRFFQVAVSPQDGPNCRFSPVCSAYGKRAVERHGLIAGLALACERIIRCNPYTPPGDDPVPVRILGDR
jgi:hypothetical protein